MAAKCDRCGVETNLDGSFFKELKSFSRAVQTFCPSCWLKRQHSVVAWVCGFNLALGGLGFVLNMIWPDAGEGWALINLFFFQVFLTLTIIPHELGHAWAARLLGMRVVRIYVGSGKSLFTVRLTGYDVEFRAVPLGGLALATHPTVEWLRARQFGFILAGPLVNAMLAAGVWLLLDTTQLWTLEPMEQGLQLGLLFFYANLAVLVENLWLHNVATALGVFASDGKQLLTTPFLSPETRAQYHAAGFVLEVNACHQRGDFEGARDWVDKGLALYPDNEALRSWQGVIAIDLGDYRTARDCFLELLHTEGKQPLLRPCMLNNVAFANALLGESELLQEADAYSQEALAALAWLPAAKGTRGAVLVAMGRFEEAVPYLQEAMALTEIPNHKASSACLLSIVRARQGNLAEAQQYLTEARKLEPRCHLLARAERAIDEASPLKDHGSR